MTIFTKNLGARLLVLFYKYFIKINVFRKSECGIIIILKCKNILMSYFIETIFFLRWGNGHNFSENVDVQLYVNIIKMIVFK